MSATQNRLFILEQQHRRMQERLLALEARLGAAPAPASSRRSSPSEVQDRRLDAVGLGSPASVEATAAPKRARPGVEELLGGRVLAWVGGTAVLVGLALLFALGVSNGSIGEGERCAAVAAGCAALLALGVRLHERAGRTQAARAAVATALAGLFLTLAVATSSYDLLPSAAGLALAAAVGALAVVLAVRWRAPVVAALGIVGALGSPVLAGVGGESAGLWFLAVAGGAAVGVLVWQRWPWLSACVTAVATPQWLWWLAEAEGLDGVRGPAAVLLVLTVFCVLQGVAAVGAAVRGRDERIGGLPALLLAANALVFGLAGWSALLDTGSRTVALGWLAALAAAYVALGLAARRTPRLSGDLGLLGLTLGVVLVDVAFALAADGVVLAVGWTAGAVAFAGLTRLARADAGAVSPSPSRAERFGAFGPPAAASDRRRPTRVGPSAARAAALVLSHLRRAGGSDATSAASGLGLHVALAIGATVPAVDAETLLQGGAPSGAAVAMLAALAGACVVSARLAPAHRLALDVTGLAAAGLLAALTLDGVALTAAWALEAVALCTLGARGDRLAWTAGLVHLAAAAAWCVADQAPPAGLAAPTAGLGAAALGLGAVLAAAGWVVILAPASERRPLLGALAVGGLYLTSLAVVAVGVPGVRDGQLRLSGLWALVGVGALVAGLRRDLGALRAGALALLAITVAKVFVYDLATQEASYRVASFLGLGVLLLGAAFAYQRLRLEAPGDPEGVSL